jgi:hypothetical protein
MTLRMDRVAGGLAGVVAGYRARLERMEAAAHAADGALATWDADPAGSDALIEQHMRDDPRPFALSAGEPPLAVFEAPPFTPVTVVAADGSSIEADRYAAVPCYVVNVGWVALPYGLGAEPVLDSAAVVGPRAGNVEDEEYLAGGINLLRDVAELQKGAEVARGALASGPAVLLLDGTIIPWDLDSRQVPEGVRKRLREATKDALAELSINEGQLSAGAYVSGSRAGNVITSLAALAPVDSPWWPESDGWLFGRLLRDGQRSALFRAASAFAGRVEKGFDPIQEVRFFYLRSGDDVARVELPAAVASPQQVARLHATIVDQCRRCDGYPRALQEAHEQAVISAGDRLQFSRLLEQEAARAALHTSGNNKQMSKRRRAV